MKRFLLLTLGDHISQIVVRILILLLPCAIYIFSNNPHFLNPDKPSQIIHIIIIFIVTILLNIFIRWTEDFFEYFANGAYENVAKMILQSFFKNKYQKIWFDILTYSIFIAIFLPFFPCDWSMTFEVFSGLFIHQKAFIYWDVIAILISLLLSFLYYLKCFLRNFRLITYEDSNGDGHNCGWMFIISVLAIVSALSLVGSIFFLVIHHDYLWMLIFLIFAGSCYLGIDAIYITRANHKLRFLNISNPDESKPVEEKIKEFKFSLTQGNIPATVGFVVLLAVYFLFKDTNSVNYIEGFVAGGAAMHMVFGNIIVGIGLGGEQ